MNCPRCDSDKKDHRTDYEGKESGKVVWTVFYCQRCAFTWRDSEPADTIDINSREDWFRVYPDEPDRYRHNIPPAKEK